MRITRLLIEELFGPGSHTIDIPFNQDDRVTILHGRNGSGKTVTLKLLEAIQQQRFGTLASYPFKRIRLELSDGTCLEFHPGSWSGGNLELLPEIKFVHTDIVSGFTGVEQVDLDLRQRLAKPVAPVIWGLILNLLAGLDFSRKKRVEANQGGYQVFSDTGSPLPLRCLSSGEQRELALLHQVTFAEPGSLVLIDEPENSLHVTRQRDLLPKLLELAKQGDFDILLATHSPYIVGDRDDLMVAIGTQEVS